MRQSCRAQSEGHRGMAIGLVANLLTALTVTTTPSSFSRRNQHECHAHLSKHMCFPVCVMTRVVYEVEVNSR